MRRIFVELDETEETRPAATGVDDVSPSNRDGETKRGGDFCDGIIVAADALYRRTANKSYSRKLVLFTDAAHTANVDPVLLQTVVDGLVRMETVLTVIGLDFKNSAEFEGPLIPSSNNDVIKVKIPGKNKDEERIVNIGDVGKSRNAGSGSDGDDGNQTTDSKKERENGNVEHYIEDNLTYIKSENEKLLISLARLTGGSVVAASSLQQILKSTQGKRIPISTRRKLLLTIAPNVTVNARFSLLISAAKLPSLRREAIMIDEENGGVIMKNGLGEEMTSKITTSTTHYNPDEKDVEVPLSKRTHAFRYGSDLIPIGPFDLEGLKFRSPVSMHILCYTKEENVPRQFFMNQPYAVSGGDSNRACGAISALATALANLKQAAICKFIKSKDADPIIGALFPYSEGIDQKKAEYKHLFFIQVPFDDDVTSLQLPPLHKFSKDEPKMKVCYDLIDSLMLPTDVLCSGKVPNPSIRFFNKTIFKRAVESTHSIMDVAKKSDIQNKETSTAEFSLCTPSEILNGAKDNIRDFWEAFPLTRVERENSKSKKPKRAHWCDVPSM